MSTTKCLSIWQSIKVESPQSVFKRYDATHPLDFYLGIDGDGRYLLLFVSLEEPPYQLDMRAIRLKKSRRDDGKWSLLLILEDAGLLELFALLSEDLVEHARHVGDNVSPLNFVLRRLTSWRNLLERAVDDLLSLHSIRGLCGELIYLEKIIEELGHIDAVRAWVGPSGADQDFQFGSLAWEVKTIRPGAESVIIASERQLDSVDKTVALIAVELSDVSSGSDDGFTLNFQVSKLRQNFSCCYEALHEFDNQLLVAGYFVRKEYEAHFFKLRSLTTFDVRDGFPCVGHKDIPVGVANVRYEIQLTACENFMTEKTSF